MRSVAVTAMVLLAALVAPPHAEAGSSDQCDRSSTVCGSGKDDVFEVGGTEGLPPAAPGDGGSVTDVGLSPTYKVVRYVPTCTGNTWRDGTAICTAALTRCPQGKALVQYWRWEATVVRATGEVVTPPGWVQSPGVFCLGPKAAGLPVGVAIAGLVAREFQDLVVVRARVHAQPAGRTLVNYETGFWTDARRYVLPAVTVLGHRVLITASPERVDWFFGDGSTLPDGGVGERDTLSVSHTYRRAGSVGPYVVVTWSGTFTVDGGPPQQVLGTARTTGPAAGLQVQQARAELVTR